MSVLELVARCYDACSSGDAEGVAGTTTPDVVHYFLSRGRIAEIRSYYRQPFDTELNGFPHGDRGYSTHDAVRSRRHEPAVY